MDGLNFQKPRKDRTHLEYLVKLKNVLGVFVLITSPVIDALRLLRDSVQEE